MAGSRWIAPAGGSSANVGSGSIARHWRFSRDNKAAACGRSKRMRILLLTQVVPFPPDSGPKMKTYNVLRYLAQHHEVHLVSFARSDTERTNAESLRLYCSSVSTVP